jgi:hypothetical protein
MTMKAVGIGGQHHRPPWLARKTWYSRHSRPGGVPSPWTEVTRRKGRDAGRRGADDHQEIGGQAVEAKMERQLRQSDRQHGDFWRTLQRTQGNAEQRQAAGAADRKQDPRHQRQTAQGKHADHRDQQPRGNDQQHPVQMYPKCRGVQPTGRHDRRHPLVVRIMPFRPPEKTRLQSRKTRLVKCLS